MVSPIHVGFGEADNITVGIGFTVINTTSVAVQLPEVNVHV